MNNKQIAILMEKLKITTDPVECDLIEEQILILADQNESTDLNSQPKNEVFEDNSKQEILDKLDERELKRFQRNTIKNERENRYKAESRLENADEELIRQEMMNQALATNEDYAFQKTRNFCNKNKNKSKK